MQPLPNEILERILPVTASRVCKLFRDIIVSKLLHELSINSDDFTNFIDGLFVRSLTLMHKFLISHYTEFIIARVETEPELWLKLISKNESWTIQKCFELGRIEPLKTYCESKGIWLLCDVIIKYACEPLEKFKLIIDRYTSVIVKATPDDISDVTHRIIIKLINLYKYKHIKYCLEKNLISVIDIDTILANIHYSYLSDQYCACVDVINEYIDANDIPRFQYNGTMPVGLIWRANDDPKLWIAYLDHLFHDDSLMAYDSERTWERHNRSPIVMDWFIGECVNNGHYDVLINYFIGSSLDAYLPRYIPFCRIDFKNIVAFGSERLKNFILDVLIAYGCDHNPHDRDVKNIYKGIPKLTPCV